MAKKKIKRKQLRRFLSDGKLSKKELRKISSKAKARGFTGSNKRLAKIISKKSQKINPEARKTDVKTNKQRLQTMDRQANAFNYFRDLPKLGLDDFVGPIPEYVAAPVEPVLPAKPATPEPTPEPTLPTTPEPTPEPTLPTTPEPTPLGIDLDALIAGLRDQPTPAAPTINVQMPEMPKPEEALGRAKATSTYLSGGSAGGIRRRRSNRSKLGLSGLGTNQLSRNVSNLLSIRGISV